MKEKSIITLPPKEVLLRDEVEEMLLELKKKASDISFEKLNLKNFEKDHIGTGKIKEEGDYFFNSMKEAEEALQEFFQNDYNIRAISKDCVMSDEEDEFTEEMGFERGLGKVETKDGLKTSSIVSITCKNLPWWERDPQTGLPFKVISYKLVVDQEQEEEQEPAKEPEREIGYQFTLSDFWKC